MSSPKPIVKPEIHFTKHFINNEFVDSVRNETFDLKSPADESVLAKVARGTTDDVDRAVAAAVAAFEPNSEWRSLDARERGTVLYKIGDLIDENATYLSSLETYDNGKPFSEAVGDIAGCAQVFRFYAGAADKVNGQLIPADGPLLAYTRAEPVGVCGAIIPWNYPLLMASIKIAPCLAMGNTLVLKPSEEAPLTALYLASLAKKAGLPAGVLNIVCGFGKEAGFPIVLHKDVRKITFTGSTAIGKLILSEAGKQLKRVSLELGGKSPLIVFPDADLDKAVKAAHNMIMINQGQCCIAASRTFVHESIYDEFVKRSVELAKARVVGNTLETKSNIGPIINKAQHNKILDLIESGVKEGAKLECGGKRVGDKGYWIEPTVFSNVTDSMRIAREEIFGPVQQILKFKTTEEVIRRANDTNYGLGAGLFTRDINLAFKVAHAIQSGQVYVNTYLEMPVQVPFGGFKESGVGREFGLQGLEQYRELKTVIVRLGDSTETLPH